MLGHGHLNGVCTTILRGARHGRRLGDDVLELRGILATQILMSIGNRLKRKACGVLAGGQVNVDAVGVRCLGTILALHGNDQLVLVVERAVLKGLLAFKLRRA